MIDSTTVVTWQMERERSGERTFIRMVACSGAERGAGGRGAGSENSYDWSERRSGKMSAPAPLTCSVCMHVAIWTTTLNSYLLTYLRTQVRQAP